MEALRPSVSSVGKMWTAGRKKILGIAAGVTASVGGLLASDPGTPKAQERKPRDVIAADIGKMGADEFRVREKAHSDLFNYFLDSDDIDGLRMVHTAMVKSEQLELQKRVTSLFAQISERVIDRSFKPENYDYLWQKLPKNYPHPLWIDSLDHMNFNPPEFMVQKLGRANPSWHYLMKARSIKGIHWSPPWDDHREGYWRFKKDLVIGMARQWYPHEDFDTRKVQEISTYVADMETMMIPREEQVRKHHGMPSGLVQPPSDLTVKTAPPPTHAPRVLAPETISIVSP